MNPIATRVSCQFVAKNVAFGKPVGSNGIYLADLDQYVVDGDYTTKYHGVYGGILNYIYIDLVEPHAIKMITVASDNCCENRILGLDFLVGDEKPEGNPMDESKFRLFAHFPDKQYRNDVQGVTCDYIQFGRYVVIKNREYITALIFTEITVHGWPKADFK